MIDRYIELGKHCKYNQVWEGSADQGQCFWSTHRDIENIGRFVGYRKIGIFGKDWQIWEISEDFFRNGKGWYLPRLTKNRDKKD